MSANHLPHLSQLVCMATPDPIKVEKAALKEKFITVSMALVAEARCMLDDKEDLWEEKVIWVCQWEKKTGEVFPIIECDRELGVDMKIAMTDGPVVVVADKAYERWVAKEIVWGKIDKDMQRGEEASQDVGKQGASAEVPAAMAKMSHVEVTQLV
ncbi:hypothetical protein M404DRAFT_30807 [Pisolithus tinctorius Marx 270]|uniref:Uncharacterized protein n=1 Tax=Pisolithus tinctorius Marx 270 TaxID=870435 RepID=A0A0C3NU88_PISTI|nr:hypothetical protein M404DRAFT_30807 [Pisolithus tinctorius Marx 270]